MTRSVLLFNYHKPCLSELDAHWSILCICDAAQVWGGPRAMEHTKNASYRGGRTAN